MGGEGVPQHVRGHRRGDARAFGGVLKHLPGALPRQPPAAGVEEDTCGAPAAAGEFRAPAHQIGVQRGDRRAADRDQALFAALAAQQHRPGVGVDVVEVEAHRLGDPRAGRVQQFQQRTVAQRQRTVGFAVAAGAVEQGQHLVDAQALGKPAAGRRRFHLTGDVDRSDSLGGGESVQAAHRDQRPGGRNRRQRHHPVVRVTAAQGHQELADIDLRHARQIVDPPGVEVFGVTPQIPAVGTQRVRRHPPLDRQVVEVSAELFVEGRTEGQRVGGHPCPFRCANAVGRSIQGASTGRRRSTGGIAWAARIPATEIELTISPE